MLSNGHAFSASLENNQRFLKFIRNHIIILTSSHFLPKIHLPSAKTFKLGFEIEVFTDKSMLEIQRWLSRK